MTRFVAIVFLSMTLIHGEARAGGNDLTQTQERMTTVEDQLTRAKQQKKRLADYEDQLQDELARVSNALAKQSQRLHQLQKDARATSQQLTALAMAQQQQRKNLSASSKKIEDVVSAMSLLALRSDSATIMGAEEAHRRVQNAIILNAIERPLHDMMTQTRTTIEQVAQRGYQLAALKEKQKQQQEQLQKEEDQLYQLIRRKQDQLQKVSYQIKSEDARIDQLSKKATDLRQLIENLSPPKENTQETHSINPQVAHQRTQEEIQEKSSSAESTVPRAPFAQSKESLVLPLQKILSSQREGDGINLTAPVGTAVLAPWYGTVIYAAQFQSLGRVMIIDHGDSYHSVMSHLATILVGIGQQVTPSEPLGTISSQDEPATLHYELRHHLSPIDPVTWFEQKQWTLNTSGG